jgi:hypothetical protein
MIWRALIPSVVGMRHVLVLRFCIPALAAAVLAGCAAGEATRSASISVAASELPSIPICRDEMRAYVELTKLAKLHGDGWVVFEPAVDALRQQILDCLDDKEGTFEQL